VFFSEHSVYPQKNPLMHSCHMGTAIKHPVPDWAKPSSVIFDIQTL